MGFLTPPRVDLHEYLEDGKARPEDVAENLKEMQRLNRWLGGVHALTRHLYPCLRSTQWPVSILDVGAGTAGIPQRVEHWAHAHGRKVQVYALDIFPLHLELARQVGQAQRLRLVCADALQLPFDENSMDYIISTLLLHHFDPPDLVRLLQCCSAVARRGIVMSDLVRGWIPYFGFKLLQPVFARNYLSRHDGAASIRRAYTPTELRKAAVQAGFAEAEVYKHFPWRQTLVVKQSR